MAHRLILFIDFIVAGNGPFVWFVMSLWTANQLSSGLFFYQLSDVDWNTLSSHISGRLKWLNYSGFKWRKQRMSRSTATLFIYLVTNAIQWTCSQSSRDRQRQRFWKEEDVKALNLPGWRKKYRYYKSPDQAQRRFCSSFWIQQVSSSQSIDLP